MKYILSNLSFKYDILIVFFLMKITFCFEIYSGPRQITREMAGNILELEEQKHNIYFSIKKVNK